MERLSYSTFFLLAPAVALAFPEPLPHHTALLLKRYAGFTEEQIAQGRQGATVVRTLDTGSRPEVAVVGISRLPVDISTYLQRLRAGTLYKIRDPLLQIGRFHPSPSIQDLNNLNFDQGDLETSADQNKQQLMAAIQEYEKTGAVQFGPLGGPSEAVDATALFSNARYLRAKLPTAWQHLMGDSNVPSQGANEFYMWSQLSFGFRPVTRIAQVSIWEDPRPDRLEAVVVTKQIYANRYIQASVQIDHLISDNSDPANPAVYLITFNLGQSDFLSGFSGKLIRPIVLSRSRSTAEKTLDEARQDFAKEFKRSL